MPTIDITVADRTHEEPRSRLRELMAEDEKLIAKHDQLVSELTVIREKMAENAQCQADVLVQLTKIKKSHSNGRAKS